jgi:hypothetical protein
MTQVTVLGSEQGHESAAALSAKKIGAWCAFGVNGRRMGQQCNTFVLQPVRMLADEGADAGLNRG